VPLSREAGAHGLSMFLTTTNHHELFALPDVEPRDIVELVKVGTHNGEDGDWKKVQVAVGKMFERAPFDVAAADAAGMIGVFRNKLSTPTAKAIATLLEREVPTGLEAMEGEAAEAQAAALEDEDPDEEVSVEEEDRRRYQIDFVPYLKKRGRFVLWWD
jgi:hypothetical protein